MSRPRTADPADPAGALPASGPLRLKPWQRAWVAQQLQTLPPRQRLWRLLVLALADGSPERYQAWVEQGVGGVFVPGAPDEHSARLVGQLQSRARSLGRADLLVAADIEFGEHTGADGLGFPNAMAVAATGRTVWARRMGQAAARAARRCGVNWVLSPVVDLDLNPHNPVVNTRSFGADPARVAALSRAFVHGLQGEGLAASAKHWPGDGVDWRDHHLEPSCNSLSREDWLARYAPVWRAAIDAGVRTVLCGHIGLPALDGGQSRPASLSPVLSTEWLRGELGFEGLVLSDATLMAGFSACGPRWQTLPQAVAAGCDMLLFSGQPELDVAYLERALAEGRLSWARVNQALARVLALQCVLGLVPSPRRSVALPSMKRDEPAERAQEQQWARECAAAALTRVRDLDGLLPLQPRRHRRILLVEEGERHAPFGQPLPDLRMAELLQAEGFVVTRYRPDTLVDPDLYDVLIYVLAREAGMCRGSLRLDWKRLHGDTARAMERHWHTLPHLLISFGNPYHLADASGCRCWINAYSPVPAMQQACVHALLGRAPWSGRSPVEVGAAMAAWGAVR